MFGEIKGGDMAVIQRCANQIRAGIKAGKSNQVISREVGVQSATVTAFRTPMSDRSQKQDNRVQVRKS